MLYMLFFFKWLEFLDNFCWKDIYDPEHKPLIAILELNMIHFYAFLLTKIYSLYMNYYRIIIIVFMNVHSTNKWLAGEIASRFHITKYPTLKVIRNGQPAKREYRGQRSVEAFVEFVKKQLEDPIKEFHDINDLKNLDVSQSVLRFVIVLQSVRK